MKKTYIITLFLLTLVLISCEKINDENSTKDAKELSGTVASDMVLENRVEGAEADYYIKGKWSLEANVTINAGVNIQMEAGSKIRVLTDGSLTALGTETNPVNIYGKQSTKGYWEELTFDNSFSGENKLNYVNISDGGGGFGFGMISVSGKSKVQISHCLIKNSSKSGVYLVNDNSELPAFHHNTIEECKDYPVHLNTSQLYYLDITTDFSGNGNKSIIEVGGSGLKEDVTWKKLSGPVLFISGYNNIFGDLSVEAGAELVMGPGARIIVEPQGSMKMLGTSSEKITIVADVLSPGYFEGIVYEDSNNPLNELQFVDIAYGGSGSGANLWLSGATQIKVGNSSFNHSANYGIYVSRYAAFNDLGNNSFSGNASDDIYVQP